MNSPDSGGDAGSIVLNVDRLTLMGYFSIESDTFGSGRGGDITIFAKDRISISGSKPDFFPFKGFFSVISTESHGLGHAGNIHIETPQLNIEGADISVSTFEKGDAGNIDLSVNRLTLAHGATISSDTEFETGRGGDIRISAKDLISISDPFSSITATTSDSAKGGNILLEARQIELVNKAAISASSSGTGDAGNISIHANDTFRSRNGSVLTQADQAGGGNIEISARNVQLTRQSPITTSVAQGEGRGGNVTINTKTFVARDDSDIRASADQGFGGDITINAEVFLRSADVQLNASSNVLGNAGTVQVNVPALDINSSLVNLPVSFLNAASLLSQRCGTRTVATASSLTIMGCGCVPPSPDTVLPGTYTDDRLSHEE